MAAPAALGVSKLFYPETERSLTTMDNIELPKVLQADSSDLLGLLWFLVVHYVPNSARVHWTLAELAGHKLGESNPGLSLSGLISVQSGAATHVWYYVRFTL